ncbi:ABC transporter substrate-binding protein [Granulicella sp. 5B5]|uniref:menaquinone biosynthetic enzyme MqnA/MqnD family protein n=1 Tax=Granulicella sp. 5B5 TaxID=1617967 RepID=UPI0015F7466C|nr:menaquinone biosynthesis protein [Granulicella sp. 5B5]QMV18075.1 ABC transporter substrate-binding protein [Granulicella sp. 5B5]
MRIAAISFLNPAPLLYNFEHEPTATDLSTRYSVNYTLPSACAEQLHAGTADLGLIPIASLTPQLAIVPGCTIASLNEVRSILLLVKNPAALSRDEALTRVRTVAADAASRSSQAYTHILFEHFHHTRPTFHEEDAAQDDSPIRMLAAHDAALLIGDPALLAREHRAQIDAAHPNLLWLDLAQLWRELTGLPWVAAVWAVRPEALTNFPATQLIDDLIASRDAGLANTETLVTEWAPRIPIPATTIRTYLTQNIHYTLDSDCLRSIELFRTLAAKINTLPPLPTLNLLD